MLDRTLSTFKSANFGKIGTQKVGGGQIFRMAVAGRSRLVCRHGGSALFLCIDVLTLFSPLLFVGQKSLGSHRQK